jgi:hypothetical protein
LRDGTHTGKKREGTIMPTSSAPSPFLCPSTVFETLLEPVHHFVEQQEHERDHHQNETFTYLAFFRLLTYYFVSDIPSIALLINTYLKKALLPSVLRLHYVARSTFNDAFERFSPDLFRAVFVFLLSTVSLRVVPELARLGVFYCIDGSLFPTLCSMRWAEYTSTSQAIKLHLCFELNRMIAIDLLVGTGNSSERHALRRMLTAGVTYIADRGYVSFQLFHDVLKAHAHLIFRMKANLKYQGRAVLPVDVPVAAQTLFRDISDSLIVCDNDPFGYVYRLVSFRVGTSAFLLVTTRRDLTTFQILLLYAYRWQVELIFRFLKRTMTGIHLINHSQDGVTIHFYMLLIVALLQLHLKQRAVVHSKQVEQFTGQTPLQTQEPSQTSPSTSKTIFHDVPSHTTLSHPYHFFTMIGEKLTTYWKIGIHWLSTLRSILSHPFNDRALELLGSG